MNYFGHAAIASHRSSEPAFVLGAMLPDLCAMIGMSCPTSLGTLVHEGLIFHMLTDAVFHQTSVFISHNRRVLTELLRLEVRRGPARAAAHIGVEMLIDASLVENNNYLAAYTAALRWGVTACAKQPTASLLDECSYADPQVELTRLLLLLADRGPAVFHASRLRLHERLHGALAHRPRLSPSPVELSIISGCLEADSQVKRDVDLLMDEILQSSQLALPPRSTEPASPRRFMP